MNGEDSPIVSVLITSYNRQNYICDTVESILNQTFKSFEIIICDNCSTDDTMKVIGKYANNPKIRIYQNEVNIGQFPNRNKIAGYAMGKYLKYVDSDDLLYPTCLEIMVGSMEKFPDAGFGLYNDHDDLRPHPFMLKPREAYEYHYLNKPVFERSPLGAILRREAFESVGGFRDISLAGDFEMWHRLACNFPLVLIGNGLGWYRVHDAQEMNRYSENMEQYNAVTAKYLTGNLNPLDDSTKQKLYSKEKAILFKHTLKNIIKLNFSKSKRMFNLYKMYGN